MSKKADRFIFYVGVRFIEPERLKEKGTVPFFEHFSCRGLIHQARGATRVVGLVPEPDKAKGQSRRLQPARKRSVGTVPDVIARSDSDVAIPQAPACEKTECGDCPYLRSEARRIGTVPLRKREKGQSRRLQPAN